MKHVFFLAPSGTGAGLTTVSLGLFNSLDSHGVRVSFFKPISQRTDDTLGRDRSTHFVRTTTTLRPADPIPVTTANKMISEGRLDPVNDLSRGALVDDIVYTIALTAIQATQG
jgi:phosphate acetyltransferase